MTKILVDEQSDEYQSQMEVLKKEKENEKRKKIFLKNIRLVGVIFLCITVGLCLYSIFIDETNINESQIRKELGKKELEILNQRERINRLTIQNNEISRRLSVLEIEINKLKKNQRVEVQQKFPQKRVRSYLGNIFDEDPFFN